MKIALIVGAVIVLAGGGTALYLANTNDESTQTQQSQTEIQSETQTQQTTTVQENQVSVSISNFSFPDIIRISKGTTVTWTNQDSVGHNVVSDEDSPQRGLNGPLLGKGESFSFTFDTAGTYTYHCTPHPNMTATVEVVE